MRHISVLIYSKVYSPTQVILKTKLPTDYKCISHDKVHNVSGMAVKIVNEFNDERIVLLNEKQHHNL